MKEQPPRKQPKEQPAEDLQEQEKSNKGLVTLLFIEIAGILGVAVYWLAKFL